MSTSMTYQLLDTGHGVKLEQVGPYRLIRPALQALWHPSQPPLLWESADACYQRQSTGSGSWLYHRPVPPSWTVTYCGLSLQIKMTDFGHLGFFAEHGPHWQWLHAQIVAAKRPIRVLNAFAHTGAGTLAAAAAGAQVVHLDAAEGIVTWARDNAQLAGLSTAPIRWIVEDVHKFLKREIRRERTYEVILLDPPSFGRGNKGEVWKFTRDIRSLLQLCRQVLSHEPLAVLLSAHTPGVTPLVLENLLVEMMGTESGIIKSMEMSIPQSDGQRALPSGALARWSGSNHP